ncbi:hypothetical protein [Streptomyces sp. NPDC006879]|uniref:hypothetical protein n=1 Tax=Streptomyces sp. NPDC006879 TaxID=3364767 RepID=UPI0036B12F94
MSNEPQQPGFDPLDPSYDPFAQRSHPSAPEPGPVPQDPYATQTWQAETWDTTYQPVYQDPRVAGQPGPYGQWPDQQHPQQPQNGHEQQAPWPAADDAAHLPQQPLPYAPAQAPRHLVDSEPGTGPAAGGGSGPAYSAPTTLGNTRITDAQRARAEGRSPIIDPGMQPALLTAVLGVLLASAAALGQFALLVPVVLLQALTAAGWFRLNGMWPARQGIALAFAGALVADAALLAVAQVHAPAAILGTLGVWVLLTLVLQLRSHASPDERVYGLMASVASAALAVLCTGYLAADPQAATVGAAAVAVAVVVRALPLPQAASVVVSLLGAVGAGIAVAGLAGLGSGGALLGLVCGVCALVGLRVAAYDYPSRFVHMTAGVALPLAAAAPAVYLIGRVVA